MKKDKLVGFVDDDNKAMTSREQLQISVQLDSVDDNEDIVLQQTGASPRTQKSKQTTPKSANSAKEKVSLKASMEKMRLQLDDEILARAAAEEEVQSLKAQLSEKDQRI